MTPLVTLFAPTLAVAAALAWISAGTPRPLPVRLAVLALAGLFLPLAYLSMAELLGRPKPARLEWRSPPAGEVDVLASSLAEGRAIYLWLRAGGDAEPRAYALPWDRRLAQQLQEAGREAGRQGTGVRARLPLEPTLDDREPRFYADPQPAAPEKAAPAPAAPWLFTAPG